jgi:hypothetical protein
LTLYYCSDADITEQLPDSLTDSPIDTAAKRNAKLRGPARDWVDSKYPGVAPFAQVGAQSVDWLVNQADHASGDTTVTVDGGTGDPVVGDEFRVELQNTWYRVSAYSSNVITFASRLAGDPDWDGAALADFPDNARLYLGTPGLIRTAATHYATALGILLLRRNPEDKMVAAMYDLADRTLGISSGGLATVPPWPYTDYADDAASSPPIFTAGEAELMR